MVAAWKENPAPAFGSRERTKAYGYKKGGHGSGARADRRRKRQAGRKAATRAQETLERLTRLQAEGKKLTTTQKKALERAEARLQAEGALPDDIELEAMAKAHQAQEKSLDAVLGTGRKTHAVKLALENRPFHGADLQALKDAGWILRSAGTVPAKVGRTLAALNPTDDLDRLLGPRGEVRAVIVWSPEPFGEDLVRALQEDGYDVSPAPKELREARHQATPRDTERRGNPEPEPMSAKTTGRKKAASTSRGPQRPKPADRGEKPSRPTSRKKTNPTAAPKAKAPAKHHVKPAATRKPGRPSHRLNPTDARGLAKIWKTWTGAEPSKVIELDVEGAKRHGLPAQAVLLGRVSWFATKDGREERFADSGPLMITDAAAKRIWLVSSEPRTFDLAPALIGYLARKPKFGDRELVEYVHAFEGKTHAVMDGQVGSLAGAFRITPAGLEG
ncbi:MAG TPA: hypothetical protein VJ549_00505 [Geothrix sp.]|nr:hypothetical protein [Geothrix sp.]HJV47728.1 hypothetical protein [Geothrix sp.]